MNTATIGVTDLAREIDMRIDPNTQLGARAVAARAEPTKHYERFTCHGCSRVFSRVTGHALCQACRAQPP